MLIDEGVKQYKAAQAGSWLPRPSGSSAWIRGHDHPLDGFLTADVSKRYEAAIFGFKHAEEMAGGWRSGGYLTETATYREIAVGIHPRIYAAYVAIAVNYLAEVQELMPKYAEDSGQGKRRDPITINASRIGVVGDVTNSNISVADTINSIGTSIQAVSDRGQTDAAAAIRALAEAIQQDPGLAENLRAQLLDHVADVADAAAAPEEPRRLNRARAAMAAITASAGASSQLAQAVSTWHGVLGQLF